VVRSQGGYTRRFGPLPSGRKSGSPGPTGRSRRRARANTCARSSRAVTLERGSRQGAVSRRPGPKPAAREWAAGTASHAREPPRRSSVQLALLLRNQTESPQDLGGSRQMASRGCIRSAPGPTRAGKDERAGARRPSARQRPACKRAVATGFARAETSGSFASQCPHSPRSTGRDTPAAQRGRAISGTQAANAPQARHAVSPPSASCGRAGQSPRRGPSPSATALRKP
jgi:hypothetical protein